MRVFEGSPSPLPETLRSNDNRFQGVFLSSLIVVADAFRVLPHPVVVVLAAAVADHIRLDPVEGEVFVELSDAEVPRQVELSSSIETEDVTEDLRIAIEEDLLSLVVYVELAFLRPEQRVRKLLDRVNPGFEPATTDVDAQFDVRLRLSERGSHGRHWVAGDRDPTDGRGANEGQPRSDARHSGKPGLIQPSQCLTHKTSNYEATDQIRRLPEILKDCETEKGDI